NYLTYKLLSLAVLPISPKSNPGVMLNYPQSHRLWHPCAGSSIIAGNPCRKVAKVIFRQG
ncbi:MAG: hypothetical protein WBV22_02550, partial [Anaerolineaceae bacterium]